MYDNVLKGLFGLKDKDAIRHLNHSTIGFDQGRCSYKMCGYF